MLNLILLCKAYLPSEPNVHYPIAINSLHKDGRSSLITIQTHTTNRYTQSSEILAAQSWNNYSQNKVGEKYKH